jgi:hypothetical protein
LRLFSGLVVASAENRRAFERLTLRRMAAWGAMGGMVIPGGYLAFNAPGIGLSGIVSPLAVFGLLGAATSAGVLALARGAPEVSPTRRPDQLTDVQ